MKRNIDRKISPDHICSKNINKKIKLNINKIKDAILIEGNKKSLLFLSELIYSQALFDKDCSFEINPNGPGKAKFNKKSKYGILIHRIPCLEKKIKMNKNKDN
jgi:hypothetical protein